LDASGGRGALSSDPSNTTIYGKFVSSTNSTLNSTVGSGGAGGTGGNAYNAISTYGASNGNAGSNGVAGTSGTNPGGAGGVGSFVNFSVSSRSFLPPIGSNDLTNNIVLNGTASLLTVYGAGGTGGLGEGGSANGMTQGSMGNAGAVIIFEYTV
jgi:hypothetical protein